MTIDIRLPPDLLARAEREGLLDSDAVTELVRRERPCGVCPAAPRPAGGWPHPDINLKELIATGAGRL
ncbi:MAG: hypothetical protein ACFCVE_13875 [Phycisphaerae bacterium]